MAPAQSANSLVGLITRLCALPESGWIEFKENNTDPDEMGQYISALSNSAALEERATAYMLWGVRDSDRAIVGTTAAPAGQKVGNEDVINWLTRSLDPQVGFSFHECSVEGKAVVVLEIESASSHPTTWQNVAYVRVGSYKKKLKDHVKMERRLWQILDKTSFEAKVAVDGLTAEEVLARIDYPAYFELYGSALPPGSTGVLAALGQEKFAWQNDDGTWAISNLGALLFAKDVLSFDALGRKVARVITYKGKDRLEAVKEYSGRRGYANGFAGLIEYIINALPTNEVIGQSLRRSVPMYPELAVRELVANALIHQDFSVSGAGPLIELFDDRLEITNPGTPLIDPERFVDAPPRSRNEKLAWHMRRCGICEERGSGWDKIAAQIELFQLPAPLVETVEGHTRVTLFSHRTLAEMDRSDRARALYLHACLQWVRREPMNNTSVRKRLGIETKNAAIASRLISDAVAAGVIAPFDSQAGRGQMRYVPFWASSASE